MAIIQGAMQAKPPMPAAQPAAGNIENAVHRIVAAGTKIMYQPEIAKNLVAMVKSDQSPPAGLAHAVMFLMAQMTKLSKNTMPPAAKAPAIKELTVLVAELAEAAGAIQGDVKPVIIAARKMIADGLQQASGAQPGQTPMQPSPPVQPFIQR